MKTIPITYQDAQGRWRCVDVESESDIAEAVKWIESNGGIVGMVNSHWYKTQTAQGG